MLRVGILLESGTVPLWVNEVIRKVDTHEVKIVVAVINTTEIPSKKSRWLYKILRFFDRTIFSVNHDAFTRVLLEYPPSVPRLVVEPLKKGIRTFLSEKDISAIRNFRPDVLIRFGFGILTGDILTLPTYGVWSLHHGDNAINRGGPPGFWEVVNKEAVTGVTLQKLTNDLDGGIVLNKAFVKTDLTSFNRNQNLIFWAGVELFCSTLYKFTVTRDLSTLNSQKEQLGFYSHRLYLDPGTWRSGSIFFFFWLRRFNEALISIFTRQQWLIYYKLNNERIETSLFRYKKLTPPRGVDWADPFVVKREDQYYVFFEELNYKSRRAHISCFIFDEKGKLCTPSPSMVLEEPFHLSYPFVFELESTWYMVPESANDKNVWLYECEQFPDRWVKKKALLSGVSVYDPTLFYHNKVWYLFGTQKPFNGNSADQYLYIYYSEALLGEWKPHPQNPVMRDVRGARPAGRIFERNGKLIRPSQIGAPKYGYGVRFNEIIILTPTAFEERPINDILPDWEEDLLAVHTFNFDHNFSVVDGQKQRFLG